MAMREVKVKSNIPIYSIGATWFLYSLAFRMYSITDFVIVGCLSAVIYFGLSFVIPDKTVKIQEPDFAKSGDKLVDDVIEKGNAMLKELSQLGESVTTIELKENISQLHKTGTSIYSYVAKNPGSVKAINKFNDYYFPETLKILRAYNEINSIGANVENINETKAKIENAMSTMISVFNKQLDNLLYDKTFDVRTDIKVLETLLAEEGLSNKKD